MTEFLQNFHFIRPWYLLLLVLPFLYYWRYMRGVDNTSSWEKVCDKNLLCYLLVRGSSGQRKMLYSLFLAGFITAVIAISGPAWKKKEVPLLAADNPLMILLNLSSEMMATDITPNRLFRTKYKLADFLNLLSGVQAGLIVYAEEPFMITPVTNDVKIIANLLPAIGMDIMPANGDRLDRAIEMAVESMRNSGFKSGNIVIFAPDGGTRVDLSIKAAVMAKDFGYSLHIIAVSKENSEKLKLIADKVGGLYSTMRNDDSDVRKIADKINSEVSEDLEKTESMRGIFEDFGYYLTIVPLLCCLMFFRRGLFVFIFMIMATPAQAGFFMNNNQQGLKAFNVEDFETAAEKFQDSRWRGAALYRKGDFEGAYKEFAKRDDITSMYNQGNALAKAGKIEEAIKKYEAVLEKKPKHGDAKFNLEYLKQQQQEQPQNQQGNNDNQEDKDEKKEQQNQNQEQQQQQNQQEQNKQQDQQQQGEEQQDKQQEQEKDKQQEQNKEQQASQEQAKPENSKQSDEQQQNMNKDQPSDDKEKKEEKKVKPKPDTSKETKEPPKFDEKAYAREMQFRKIPEDPGGLLREFISKEYKKNRYGDQ